MVNVLVTASTGNVGSEVLSQLDKLSDKVNVFAGVRAKSVSELQSQNSHSKYIVFDFSDCTTFESSFTDIEVLFLILPPGLSNYKKIFQSIVDTAKKVGVKYLIYMSVQGVQNNKWIPHHYIEQIIETSGIDFTFLRPAYFMQNFVTTLKPDISNRIIFLPAGNVQFSLVDIRDIARVTVKIVLSLNTHKKQKYDLTSDELLSFPQMTQILNQHLDCKVTYQSPDPITFLVQKLGEGQKLDYVLVLIMLHFLPRFQKLPLISDSILTLTGKKPITFDQFVIDYELALNS